MRFGKRIVKRLGLSLFDYRMAGKRLVYWMHQIDKEAEV